MGRTATYDLVGIGRAFTDVIAEVDNEFIVSNGLPKGRGVDVSALELIRIRSELETCTLQPGGSASNTVAGVASLGGKAAFIGKLCNDASGRSFRNAFRQVDVLFPTTDYPFESGMMSPTCLVLMTPEGSVTIVNNQGVADKLTRDDIDTSIISDSSALLIPAEMLASRESADATGFAIDVALRSNRKIAISLNNLYLKGKNDFLARADFVFGNKNEFKHNFPGAELEDFRNTDTIYIITDGSNGARIAGKTHLMHVPAVDLVPNAQTAVPSYVGAGDQFAAGFLFGFAKGLPYIECGRLGAETAAAVLRSAGARPKGDWTSIAARYIHAPAMLGRPSSVKGPEA